MHLLSPATPLAREFPADAYKPTITIYPPEQLGGKFKLIVSNPWADAIANVNLRWAVADGRIKGKNAAIISLLKGGETQEFEFEVFEPAPSMTMQVTDISWNHYTEVGAMPNMEQAVAMPQTPEIRRVIGRDQATGEPVMVAVSNDGGLSSSIETATEADILADAKAREAHITGVIGHIAAALDEPDLSVGPEEPRQQ